MLINGHAKPAEPFGATLAVSPDLLILDFASARAYADKSAARLQMSEPLCRPKVLCCRLARSPIRENPRAIKCVSVCHSLSGRANWPLTGQQVASTRREPAKVVCSLFGRGQTTKSITAAAAAAANQSMISFSARSRLLSHTQTLVSLDRSPALLSLHSTDHRRRCELRLRSKRLLSGRALTCWLARVDSRQRTTSRRTWSRSLAFV